MTILWGRVVAFLMLVIAIVTFVMYRVELVRFVRSVEGIGRARTPGEMTLGLMAFGVIVVALLAALRIVLSHQDRSQL